MSVNWREKVSPENDVNIKMNCKLLLNSNAFHSMRSLWLCKELTGVWMDEWMDGWMNGLRIYSFLLLVDNLSPVISSVFSIGTRSIGVRN